VIKIQRPFLIITFSYVLSTRESDIRTAKQDRNIISAFASIIDTTFARPWMWQGTGTVPGCKDGYG
jgi:hypothetical protein